MDIFLLNYLHENLVKSPTVSTSYVMPFGTPVCAPSVQPACSSCDMSVIAPVRASPIPSILPYNDEHQEFLDGFPGTKYGERKPIRNYG